MNARSRAEVARLSARKIKGNFLQVLCNTAVTGQGVTRGQELVPREMHS